MMNWERNINDIIKYTFQFLHEWLSHIPSFHKLVSHLLKSQVLYPYIINIVSNYQY